jgi:hypothetical protein
LSPKREGEGRETEKKKERKKERKKEGGREGGEREKRMVKKKESFLKRKKES